MALTDWEEVSMVAMLTFTSVEICYEKIDFRFYVSCLETLPRNFVFVTNSHEDFSTAEPNANTDDQCK